MRHKFYTNVLLNNTFKNRSALKVHFKRTYFKNIGYLGCIFLSLCCNFRIGNEVIDVVQNYTYLGTRITSSGNFAPSLEHLRQKALHALFSLRRHTDLNNLKPSLACKIFDSMISPNLTYNSEVWGAFVKSDFKSWDSSAIEKTHVQFCKRYLQVHNKASNIACRAELGKFPMIIDITI